MSDEDDTDGQNFLASSSSMREVISATLCHQRCVEGLRHLIEDTKLIREMRRNSRLEATQQLRALQMALRRRLNNSENINIVTASPAAPISSVSNSIPPKNHALDSNMDSSFINCIKNDINEVSPLNSGKNIRDPDFMLTAATRELPAAFCPMPSLNEISKSKDICKMTSCNSGLSICKVDQVTEINKAGKPKEVMGKRQKISSNADLNAVKAECIEVSSRTDPYINELIEQWGGICPGGKCSKTGSLIWEVPLLEGEMMTGAKVGLKSTCEKMGMLLCGSLGTMYSVKVYKGENEEWICRRKKLIPAIMPMRYTDCEYEPSSRLFCRGAVSSLSPGVVSISKVSPKKEKLFYTNIHTDGINVVSWIENAEQFATGGNDGRVAVWKFNQDSMADDFTMSLNIRRPTNVPNVAAYMDATALKFKSQGKNQHSASQQSIYGLYSHHSTPEHLYIGSSLSELLIHDINANQTLSSFDLMHKSSAPDVALINGFPKAASSMSNVLMVNLRYPKEHRHKMALVDVRTPNRVKGCLEWTQRGVSWPKLSFIPRPYGSTCGKYVTCGGPHGNMYVWDVRKQNRNLPIASFRCKKIYGISPKFSIVVAKPNFNVDLEKQVVWTHMLSDSKQGLGLCASGQLSLVPLN